MTLLVIPTKAYSDQNPGTSGLRKKTSIFRQPKYLANFVQSIFTELWKTPSLYQDIQCPHTLIIGGDGRYYNKEAINIIIPIAFANGINRIILGQKGYLSTPAVSRLIIKNHCVGGIILTASHNPGGADYDFGIKFNCSNGGPAPDNFTKAVYQATLEIVAIKTWQFSTFPISYEAQGRSDYGEKTIDIISPTEEYCKMVQEIFEFELLKEFLQTSGIVVRLDAMHAITGPYLEAIFVDLLGLEKNSILNWLPSLDFGRRHPDPNLVYADELVGIMFGSMCGVDFGAAFDGDGDRNLILGKRFFVSPSDSLAIILANSSAIPYFRRNGVSGVARSMPTSGAVDHVAKALKMKCFEVPTGWKYFGNLMDSNEISLCGEESFGTGSNHIREKDGIWAALCWLSILATEWKNNDRILVGVQDITEKHWRLYGRNYYMRYDYENVESVDADAVIQNLINTCIINYCPKNNQNLPMFAPFVLKKADEYSYCDHIDKSFVDKQGIRLIFQDGSRIIFRLSGTGSVGATIRIYFDMYKGPDSPEGQLFMEPSKALEQLIQVGLKVSNIQSLCHREEPTVIT